MGSKSDKTTTQETTPWEGQTPYLEDLFSQAQGLFQGGPQEYYPGQTVAPFAPQTMQGMDMMTQRALAGSPQQDQFGNYLSQTMGQQNYNPAEMFGYGSQAAGGTGMGQRMMANAGADPLSGGVPNVGGGQGEAQSLQGSLPGISAGQLGGTAQGNYLGSNPYLDQMFQQASGRAGEAFNEQTMPALAAQFGGAGRTGSGIHQEMGQNATRQFGRDLQGMAADIYAPAYESERDRQIQAAQGGGQYDLGSRGLQAQAGAGLGSLGMQGLGHMGDLYGNIGQEQFRAGTLMPSYNDMQYGDMQRLMGVGGMMEDQTQRLMGANQDRWNFGQGADWQNLQNYGNTIYGLPGSYGTQTQTTPGGSRLGGMIGGAMSGASMGPWGMLGGGILGGMG
jgi:hypothetical protein